MDDGADFYRRRSIPTILYDTLFASPSIAGDLDYYEAFCPANGPRIIDAACGTGRIARALARPDRRIVAFDSSPYFVGQMKREVVANPAAGPIDVFEDRLESFSFAGTYDGIVVSYYAFNHILSPGGRAACFDRLMHHLRPGGRAAIHVARPDLLTRDVPGHELASLCFEREIALPDRSTVTLQQEVGSMRYDRTRGVRSIDYRFRFLKDGAVLHEDRLTKQLAAVSTSSIAAMARGHGARIVRSSTGFRDDVLSEGVFEIEKP